MNKQTFIVEGMHCASCAMLIKDALEEAGDEIVTIKQIEKNKGKVIVMSKRSTDVIAKAISSEGDYMVTAE